MTAVNDIDNGHCSPTESCWGMRTSRSSNALIGATLGGEPVVVLPVTADRRQGAIVNYCPFCGEWLRIHEEAPDVVAQVLRNLGLRNGRPTG